MSFYAKATLGVLAFWCGTDTIWNLQVHHPWRAFAIIVIVAVCLIIIEVAKKGKR